MRSKNKVDVLLQDLGNALIRLAEALKQPENGFIRDPAIQRFEFCFELSWKSIQSVARLEGQDCPSPRMAVSVAWQNRWLTEESIWLDMLEERNRTSHTYHETTAKEVFNNLPGYLPHLTALHTMLVKRIEEIKRSENDRPNEPGET